MLTKNPNSTVVYTASISEVLDDTRGIEYIASGGIVFDIEAATAVGTTVAVLFPIYRDIKAQRKLKKGDDISLQLVGDNNNDVKFVGTIDLWFKQ